MYSNAEQALSLAAANQPIDRTVVLAAIEELQPLVGLGSSVSIRCAYQGLQQLAVGVEWNPIVRRWLAQTADLVRAIGEEEAALRALMVPTVAQLCAPRVETELACA